MALFQRTEMRNTLDRVPWKWDIFEQDIQTDLPRRGGQVDGRKKLLVSIIRLAKDEAMGPCRYRHVVRGRWQHLECIHCDAVDFFENPDGERVINLRTICDTLGLEVDFVVRMVRGVQAKGYRYRHQVRR